MRDFEIAALDFLLSFGEPALEFFVRFGFSALLSPESMSTALLAAVAFDLLRVLVDGVVVVGAASDTVCSFRLFCFDGRPI